jgi:hypothetical protein
MGEEINIEKIEVYEDCYQIDIRYEESGKGERIFIRKDALFALLCVAEKESGYRIVRDK